jgi:hypothetical protein
MCVRINQLHKDYKGAQIDSVSKNANIISFAILLV